MPRKLYVYRSGLGVVPIEEAPPRENFHAVHADEMAPTWHPADSKIYTSKSNFRNTTRAAGYVEVGTDLLSQRKREKPAEKPISESLKKHLWDSIDRAYHKKN